jgi:hypothetical protein
MEQVWFPGVHCSVGGGDSYRGLSTIALCWMVHKLAKCTNLELDLEYVVASFKTFEPNVKGVKLDESPDGWACTQWEPSYVGMYRLGGRRARKPGRYYHLREGETTNEYVHWSVEVRQNKKSYTPPSLAGLPQAEFGDLERELKERIWGPA